jgi:hypothetical protein
MALRAQYSNTPNGIQKIAVFGETKTWKEDLKALGGRFFKNIDNQGPAWSFPKEKEAELMQFIANANAGVVQPTPFPTASQQAQASASAPAPMVSGVAPPAMTPEQAMEALRNSGPVPEIHMDTEPQTLRPPNLFLGADGLGYQVIIQTVVFPKVGLKVTVTHLDGTATHYTVSSLESTSFPYNSILLQQVVADDSAATPGGVASSEAAPEPVRAHIVNGAWQLAGVIAEHSLSFAN